MLKKLSFLTCVGLSVLTSTAFSQITFDEDTAVSMPFGTGQTPLIQESYVLEDFDAGTNTKLVVGFGVENGTPSSFSVTFGETALTPIQTSADAGFNATTGIFFLDGASGVGDITVVAGPASAPGNGPGVYAVALSGAAPGFETSGALGNGQALFGDLTGTLTGISEGAFVITVFADQNQPGDQTVTGDLIDLMQVSDFNGTNDDQIGSAVSIVASGFGSGSDHSITFNDLGANNAGNARSNASYASFAVGEVDVLLGDVNLDGVVNFLDISPFIGVLSNQGTQAEADLNQDGAVSFLDISPFIMALTAA